jgi:mRNA interferase MazF
VVLPFPFSNLAASKRRPALVLASAAPHDDVILCMITSRHTRDTNAVPLDQADFTEGGLPQASNARPNRLFTAEPSIILRKAGRLTPDKLEAVVDTVICIVSDRQIGTASSDEA